jgi:hypothetical protein
VAASYGSRGKEQTGIQVRFVSFKVLDSKP